MIEVTFVTDAPRIAGSEIWLLTHLPRLRQQGFSPRVLLPNTKILNEYAQHLEYSGVPVHRFPNLAEAALQTTNAHLRVIQAWSPATYNFLLTRLPSPKAALIHDQLEYHYPAGVRGLYRLVYRLTKSRALMRSDALITVSRWGARFMEQYLGLSKVLSVCNGVDAERFKPNPQQREALRQGYGFRHFTVLVPGRMALEKNALASIRTARLAPELEFVFVGDDDSSIGMTVKWLARYWRLNNVRFLGKRWDMPQLYQAADAVLQPTLAENQSLVTLEAMASALPVVTTPIPSQAELITHEHDGLLVPAHPEALAEVLRKLAHSSALTARLGAAARTRILNNHTLEHSTDALAQVLARLIQN